MGPLGKLIDAVLIAMFAILMSSFIVETVLTVMQR